MARKPDQELSHSQLQSIKGLDNLTGLLVGHICSTLPASPERTQQIIAIQNAIESCVQAVENDLKFVKVVSELKKEVKK